MAYPAVGFGRPLPASLALTPYDRAASAFAWRQPAPSRPAAAPAMPDMDAFRAAIEAVVAQILGRTGSAGTGASAEGEGGAGSASSPGASPAPSSGASRGVARPGAVWRQPERDGRSIGGTAASGAAPSGRGAVGGTSANGAPTSLGAPAGTAGTLSGQAYSDTKRQAYRDYDPIGFGPVGEYVASGVALAHPALGLLNAGRHIYNTEETAAYQAKLGQPMGFWDHLLGWFGLTDASAGDISAAGRTVDKAQFGSGGTSGGLKYGPDGSLKASTPGLSGAITGYKPGYAPGEPLAGTTGLGETRSAGRGMAPTDDRIGPGTGGLY